MVCILPNCILYFIFSPEVILYVYQTQNRFHMLHIELGFLLHDFIRNSLQGFLNIYHIEWTIWVGSCILECGFLSSFLNVNWCKRPWKIQLHRLDNSVENVSWSLYASLFHALLGDLKIQPSQNMYHINKLHFSTAFKTVLLFMKHDTKVEKIFNRTFKWQIQTRFHCMILYQIAF